MLRFADAFVAGAVDVVRAEVGAGLPGWVSLSVHDLDGDVMVELTGSAPG